MASSPRLGLFLRWSPVVLWMAGLFWGSSLPHRPPTPGMECFRWDDKLQHAGAYAILGILAWRALAGRKGLWRAIVAVLIAAVYGIADEAHQGFVPGRECSLLDWVMDAAGATIAVALLYRWKGGDCLGE